MNYKIVFSVITGIVISLTSNAQNPVSADTANSNQKGKWSQKFAAALTLGGQRSTALGSSTSSYAFQGMANVNYTLDYFKKDYNWNTVFTSYYGLAKFAKDLPAQKTADVLMMDSKLIKRFRGSKKFVYGIEASAFTQYSPTYSYAADGTRSKIAQFGAPLYGFQAAGVAMLLKKFYFIITPIGLKEMFVFNKSIDATLFGIKNGRSSVIPGLYLKVNTTNLTLWKNCMWNASGTVFKNYNDRNSSYVVNSDIKYKVSKVLSIGWTFYMLYDTNVGTINVNSAGVPVMVTDSKPQIMQSYGLNFGYMFSK